MPRLDEEDQKRVNEYLNTTVNQVKRKPFRPLMLLAGIGVVLVILTVISYVIAIDHGVV